MKVAVLSNANMNMLSSFLQKSDEFIFADGFNTLCQDLIDENSKFNNAECDAAFIVIDVNTLVDAFGNLDKVRDELLNILSYIENSADRNRVTKYFVSTIDFINTVQPLKNRNSICKVQVSYMSMLADMCDRYKNIFIFNLAETIADSGRRMIYSPKMNYLSKIPYSLFGMKAIAASIGRYLNALRGRKKKCIVVDLDNTLWGGVIGEDGLDGIKLSNDGAGKPYYDAQRVLKDIKETGIVLAIASKNNYDDAVGPLCRHKYAVLKKDDFVVIKANWNEKVENIKQIAEELNIGIDSIVFLDDNNIECEKVRQQLPLVSVIDFPSDICMLPDVLKCVYEENFTILNLTDEDKNKTQEYIVETSRKCQLSGSINIDDYIRSLDIKINLHIAREYELERVAQLTQKTNQFNLTTQRFSISEIEKYIQSNNKIYVGDVVDKYGSYGLVFIIMLSECGDDVVIDNLLMSCRVMGRNVEQSIMMKLRDELFCKYNMIFAKYIRTEKNTPVENLLESFGFRCYNSDKLTKEMKTDKIKVQKVLCEVQLC